MIHYTQEHGRIEDVVSRQTKFDKLSLVSWEKLENNIEGYYASYKIGAEWIEENEALVVTTKRDMENIDFLSMFMTCFSSNLSIESFSKIYSISFDQPYIEISSSLINIVSPLIIIHFLGIVSKIKLLKKNYFYNSKNLKKIKGRVLILKNERNNIALKRYNRIYCEYNDYSIDIPENRLLKKALLFSKRLLSQMKNHDIYNNINQILSKCLSMFENVSSDVEIKDVKQIKSHKLFKEYDEAIRLAKLILRLFDYSINKVSIKDNKVVPFTLDMSLLYEHYVYGLLYEAYRNRILYQYAGKTGKPDFLYSSNEFKAILDTKYIPKYENEPLDYDVIRQLSGYSRDIQILKKLGYAVNEESPIPSVPCIIIYPKEYKKENNPFLNVELIKLCTEEKGLLRFYKIEIPLPTIQKK